MTRTVATITDFDIEHAISHLVAERRSNPFSTIEVIQKILGVYLKDTETPASSAPNALFGKRLSENADRYGIRQVQSDRHAIDDAGESTTTAYWEAI